MLRWAAVDGQGPWSPFPSLTRGRIGCHLMCMAFTSGLLMQWMSSTSLFFSVFAARKVFGCNLGKRWLDENFSSPLPPFPITLSSSSLLPPPLPPPPLHLHARAHAQPQPQPQRQRQPQPPPPPTHSSLLWLLILFFLRTPYVTKYSIHYTRNHNTGMILSLLLDRL